MNRKHPISVIETLPGANIPQKGLVRVVVIGSFPLATKMAIIHLPVAFGAHSELLGCFRHAQHTSDVGDVLIRGRSPHPPPEMKIYFITTVLMPKKN